jgi:hypothetical protein
MLGTIPAVSADAWQPEHETAPEGGDSAAALGVMTSKAAVAAPHTQSQQESGRWIGGAPRLILRHSSGPG